MKYLIAIAALSISTAASSLLGEELQKIAYPTADDASFVIEAPASWEITPAEKAGDFFSLEGPTGALFSFRTIKGTEKSLTAAIKESIKELGGRFDELELGDAQDWKPHGLEGLYATGTGKIKDDGTAVTLGVGWCVLEDGKIAEMWFVGETKDAKGLKQAESIGDSLSAP